MENKSWLNRINNLFTKSEEQKEIQNLQQKLESIVENFEISDTSIPTDEKEYNPYSELKSYKTKILDTDGAAYAGAGDITGSDQSIDVEALQRIYATETWVYSAVSAVAETIASLPLKLEKSKKIQKQVTNEVTGEIESVEQTVWVDASGEKLFDRFQYPNKHTTKAEFYMLLTIDLMTAGNFYIYLDAEEGVDLSNVEMDDSDDDAESPFGRLRTAMAGDTPIKAMYRIPPSIVRPVLSEDKRRVEGYVQQTAAGEYAYDAAEIIHVKYPNPLHPFNGLSPLIAAFKPVLLDRFSTEHMIRFYKSGARLGGVISSEKSLNKEQLSRFQRSFENNFTGRSNHHRTLVLPPGMKYEAIEQNPAETALLEFCKYNRDAVLSTFRVPPIKVGVMDNANYANARVQLQTFFNDCVKPKLEFIENGFNLKASLMPDNKSYRIKFDLSNVPELKDDDKEKAESAKIMLDAGLTVNEVRKMMWNRPPIPKGDKSPAIERLGQGGGLFGNLSAEPGEVKEKDAPTQEILPPTDVKPTGGTFTERVNMLVAQMVQAGVPIVLAVPKAIEQARLEGYVDEPMPAEEQKLGTGENSALIPTGIHGDKPKCEKCKQDPCVCSSPTKEGVQSLSDFIADALAKLDPSESVDPAFLAELVNIYNSQHGKPVESKEESQIDTTTAAVTPDDTSTPEAPKAMESYGFSKEKLTEQWKSFISRTDDMSEKRVDEVRKFFRSFEKVLMNRFGANIKSYGVIKARDNDDIEDLLKLEAYEEIIKRYIKEADAALLDAYKYGYNQVLGEFVFNPPNEDAIKFLEDYAAKEVQYITETTRDQMRTLLKEAFEANKPVGEVSKALREKFDEIEQGRAITIARTETLSAVSAGKDAKTQDFKKEFPDAKLKKIWVSAQDERVRDSHQTVDGEVVGIDEDFSNGLKYPRQVGQDPSEVINCRCDYTTFAEQDQELIEQPSEE